MAKSHGRSPGRYLTRAQIIGADGRGGAPDLRVADELVPEWPNADGTPGLIHLVQMNAAEALVFATAMEVPANSDAGMFLILIASAKDETGARIFTPEDIEALKLKNLDVLNRLQRVCLRLNGMLKALPTAAAPTPDSREVALKKD